MPLELAYFSIVAVTTGLTSVVLIWLTKNITFYGSNTDNQKQVAIAATSNQWKWPSEMHKILEDGMRSRMKDGHILGLVLMQRLIKDKDSDYPTILLCITTNTISAILIFLIASSYWNIHVGLLVWALFITCVWPHQLVLFGTHIGTSTMFFLLTIYLMQRPGMEIAPLELLWYFVAGITTILTFFSSGSSRKFLPLVVAGFVYSLRHALWIPNLSFDPYGPFDGVLNISLTSLSILILLASLILLRGYKIFVKAMFYEKAPRVLNRILSSRSTLSIDHYLDQGRQYMGSFFRLGIGVSIYIVACSMVVSSEIFYWAHIFFFSGFLVALLLLTVPDVLGNVWGYYRHSQGWKTNRFVTQPIYEEYFSKIGKPYKGWMRGGGLKWIFKLFWRMTPIQFVFYLIGLFSVIILMMTGEISSLHIWPFSMLMLISLSPIILGELTKSAQSGRYYYAGLMGSFLLTGYGVFVLDQTLSSPLRELMWILSLTIVILGSIWGCIVFLSDILPARMAPLRLAEFLNRSGVDSFYTYDTVYNDAFVNSLPPSILSTYEIKYIKSLDQVESGLIVIPGTSSKALNMESVMSEVLVGNFNVDIELSHLIDSKEIKDVSVASFKTFGTSRFWPQFAEVTTYRDLVLNEIKSEDRWRGRAWVVDATKLGKWRNNKCLL